MMVRWLGTCLFGSLFLHLAAGILALRMPAGSHGAVRTVAAFVVEPSGVRLPKTGAPGHTAHAMPRPAPEPERPQTLPQAGRPPLVPGDQNAGGQAPLPTASPDGARSQRTQDTVPASTALGTLPAGTPPASLPEGRPGTARQSGATGQEPEMGQAMMVGEVGAPRFIHREAPRYPYVARKLGKEGRVVLRLTLDAQGRLQGIDTVEANGFGFAEAAGAAIRKSTFAPAFKNGRAVPSQVLVPVRFVLHDGH